MENLTYTATGVDYDAMDPFKRACQEAGRRTARNLQRRGFQELHDFRGESAYLMKTPFGYLAHVEEGLGTKNLVTRAMWALKKVSYFDQVAQDAVAMIVNDLITVGALPLSVAMHLAVGNSDWFTDYPVCAKDLARGWAKACNLARCAWAGGETPTLKEVVEPDTFVLAGSATGLVTPRKRLIHEGKIKPGDAIVFLGATGIHANGLTLARRINDTLPNGYLTELSDGRRYGEALLDPTPIYVPIVEDCLEAGIDLHYAANITGHGWRKLMRPRRPFTYVVDRIPELLPIFQFIQEHGPVDDREAYGNLNMGAGFALYVAERDAPKVLSVVKKQSDGQLITAYVAGHIEEGEKKVVIPQKGIEYLGSTLGVR